MPVIGDVAVTLFDIKQLQSSSGVDKVSPCILKLQVASSFNIACSVYFFLCDFKFVLKSMSFSLHRLSNNLTRYLFINGIIYKCFVKLSYFLSTHKKLL